MSGSSAPARESLDDMLQHSAAGAQGESELERCMTTPCGGREQSSCHAQGCEITRRAVRRMAGFRPVVRASDKNRTRGWLCSAAMKRILLIGLEPTLVDFSSMPELDAA